MAKQFKKNQKFLIRETMLRLVDALCVGLGFVLANELYTGHYQSIHVYAAVTAAVVYTFMANLTGVYVSQESTVKSWRLGQISSAWTLMIFALLLFAYGTKTSSVFSRVSVTGWMLVTPGILIIVRMFFLGFYSRLSKNKEIRRTIAIAGYGETARRFIRNLRDSNGHGLTVSGIYTDDSTLLMSAISDHHDICTGSFCDLVEKVKSGVYDEVYITLDKQAENQIADLIADLSDCAIPVYFIPDVFTMNLMVSQVYHINDMPIVSIYDSPMDARDVALKRAEDIFLSILILAISALPMILIAIAIKITSPGPIIFRQRRYGLNGAPIEVWKFRSMNVCENDESVVQAKKGDARLTNLGAFLRRFSLDELPQFINVIKGDMSIVGPRPHAVVHNELYRKEIRGYMLRHLVKPGITGWAQVNGWRGETDTLEKMEMRVKYDLEYIKHWSLWFDLKIIALTVLKGFSHKNAY